MSVLEIKDLPIITEIEALSDRAEEVDIKKEGQLCQEIILALKRAIKKNSLLGLSAPQLGYNKRIIVVNFSGDLRTFINPVISGAEGLELFRESCSSIPDKRFLRIRNNKVTVMHQTPLGKIETHKFVGMSAKVIQHHIDHLEGLLLSDVGLEIDDDFDNADDETKGKIIDMYLESLDLKKKQLDKEIEEDEELKQLSDAITFMEKVQAGEVEVVREEFVLPEKKEEEDTDTDDEEKVSDDEQSN